MEVETVTLIFIVRASNDWAIREWLKLCFKIDIYAKVLYIEIWLRRVPDQVECLVVFCM